MFNFGKYIDFIDGEEISKEQGLWTCCDICGEVLEYTAKIVYNQDNDSQEIVIEATSCGEVFRLIPIRYRMEKVNKSELI